MSAYRRLNRSSKSAAFQHPSLSVYQQQQHLNSNGMSDNGATNGNLADGLLDDRQLPNNPAYPTQPKHLRFPDVSFHSEVLNELVMFAFAVIATAMQFLHLYRTVWWLPESHTSQTMVCGRNFFDSVLTNINIYVFYFLPIFSLQNFYLIDTHLTIFILVLLGRRFVYCLTIKLLESFCPRTIYAKTIRPIR